MKTRGFTLIELMIVIAILGILAAIAAPVIKRHMDGPTLNVEPLMPSNGRVVERETSSVKCQNGILLKNGDPVVKDGAAVKC